MVPFEGSALPSSSPAEKGRKGAAKRSSRGLWYRVGPVAKQLQQIVAERDELKLGPRRGQAAQQDAPEAATLLHLSEDRLDDRLAHLVQRPAFDARELVPHPLGGRCRRIRGPRRRFGAVFLATRGDEQIRALQRRVLDCFAA